MLSADCSRAILLVPKRPALASLKSETSDFLKKKDCGKCETQKQKLGYLRRDVVGELSVQQHKA